MSRSFSQGMAKPWSGTLLAFLVWLALAPGGVKAGCLSQHLKRLDATQAGVNHPDRLALLDLSEAGPLDSSQLPQAPAPPCRGALCSGSPATPITPGPVPPPLGDGQWAVCVGSLSAIPSRTGAIHPQDASLAPSTAVDRIFHPPRSL